MSLRAVGPGNADQDPSGSDRDGPEPASPDAGASQDREVAGGGQVDQSPEELRAAVRAARRERSMETSGRRARPQPLRPLHPEESETAEAQDEIRALDEAGSRGVRPQAFDVRTLEAVKIAVPPLPMPAPRRSRGVFLSFLALVALPTLLAIGYYFFIASPQFVSEFRFAVRDAKSASLSGSDASGMSELLTGTSGTRSLESYMVAEYMKSRQAVEETEKRINVRQFYSRPDIDWFGRFNDSRPMEAFVAYWDRVVTAQYDQITGIVSAQVRAFRPQDAFLIANTLLSLSEELINNLATRPQREAIRSAEAEVKKAEDRLTDVSIRLARFRNTEYVIDPTSNVVTSNALVAQNLRQQLTQLQTDLASLQKQNLDANAPMIRSIQTRIRATREQLANVEKEVANRDGANPLSKVMGEYERLDLERQFAQDAVKNALRLLDDARGQALFQHLFITAFVSPGLPQSSTYPKRYHAVAIVFFGCLLFWTAGLMFVRSVREHIS